MDAALAMMVTFSLFLNLCFSPTPLYIVLRKSFISGISISCKGLAMNGHHNPRYGIALGLIVVGAIFLLRNLHVFYFGYHWWAYFLLIPISILVADIIHRRKMNNGKLPHGAVGQLIGVFAMAAVMAVFIFDLRFHEVWPVFIILAGVAVLLGRR